MPEYPAPETPDKHGDPFSTLRRRMASPHARAWRPDQGDDNPLFARLVAVGVRVHERWGPYSVLTLATEDGEVVCWHAWGTVARQQLLDARPEVGDLLAVEDLGRRTSAAGLEYHAWRLEVERVALAAPSFGELGPGREPEPS